MSNIQFKEEIARIRAERDDAYENVEKLKKELGYQRAIRDEWKAQHSMIKAERDDARRATALRCIEICEGIVFNTDNPEECDGAYQCIEAIRTELLTEPTTSCYDCGKPADPVPMGEPLCDDCKLIRSSKA